MEKLSLTRNQIIIECLLLLLLGLSFCLLLALASYDPTDSSWSQTSSSTTIHNICGYAGAYIADIGLQFFGFIAFAFPIFLIIICFKTMISVYRFEYKPINYFKLSFRLIGILAFIFSATAFFSINIIDNNAYQAGGNIGDIIATTLLPPFDHISASFLLLVIGFACITLITHLSWLYLLEKLGELVIMVLSLLMRLWSTFGLIQGKRKKIKKEATNEQKFDVPFYGKPHSSLNLGDEDPLSIESDFIIENPKHRKIKEELEIEQAETNENNLTTQNSSALLTSISHELNMAQQFPHSNNISVNDAAIRTAFFDESVFNDRVIDDQIENDHLASRQENPKINELNEKMNKDYTIRESILSDLTVSDPIVPVGNKSDSIFDDEFSQSPGLLNENDSFDVDSKDKDISNNDSSNNHSSHIYDHQLKPIAELSIAPEPDYIRHNDNAHQAEMSASNMITSVNMDVDEEEDKYDNNPYEIKKDANSQYNENRVDNDNNLDEHDSLIHPLLRRNDNPLSKPTTPLPSLDLLTTPPTKQINVDHDALGLMAELIEQSLADYRVKTNVVDYQPGPVITRFEIELAPGIKAARISTLDRDLARSLSMPSVRVVEVIPGKPYVGIELPNENRQTVYFREVLDSTQFRESLSPLTIVLGKDISGQSVVADLAKMPHVLVAGTTGSGKSVGVNAMILSILYKSNPEDVRFIMIDPKMLELSIYEGIPHLLTPVVTDMKDAANALNWCVNEMERRYRLMSALGVRNIAGYNDKIKQAEEMGRPIPDPLWKPTNSMDLDMPSLEKLPYIVVLVDEFADLIMAVGKKVEELIARLAQKARAAGIHLVLATQRPSVDVITGLIKANIPTRIAFTVSSKIDSRTILDQMGAESLLGMGDMLYLAPNSSIPVRVHGAFVRDEEVHAVVQDWKARGAPKYIDNITAATDDAESSSDDNLEEELDPLFDQVVAFVIETQRASISSVQRKFRIGYNRAARIVEQMENEGIVSTPSHNGNRQVLARLNN